MRERAAVVNSSSVVPSFDHFRCSLSLCAYLTNPGTSKNQQQLRQQRVDVRAGPVPIVLSDISEIEAHGLREMDLRSRVRSKTRKTFHPRIVEQLRARVWQQTNVARVHVVLHAGALANPSRPVASHVADLEAQSIDVACRADTM